MTHQPRQLTQTPGHQQRGSQAHTPEVSQKLKLTPLQLFDSAGLLSNTTTSWLGATEQRPSSQRDKSKRTAAGSAVPTQELTAEPRADTATPAAEKPITVPAKELTAEPSADTAEPATPAA